MEAQVPAEASRSRLAALQDLIENQGRGFDAAMVGRRLQVLCERPGRKPGQVAGRSPYLQAVHFAGPETLLGQLVEVDIVGAGPNSLTGVIKSEFEWREPVQAAV